MNSIASFTKRITVFIFAVLLLALCSSCGRGQSQKRIYLDEWQYSLDGENYAPLERAELSSLHKLVPGRKGCIYVKSEFTIPADVHFNSCGISIGRISLASEIYFDGKLVAETGYFPPKKFSNGNRYTFVLLTADKVLHGGENELKFKIYIEGNGGIYGRSFVGEYKDASNSVNVNNFVHSTLFLLVAAFMLFTGAVYLIMFFKMQNDPTMIFFSLMSTSTIFFLLPSFIGTFSWTLGFMNYDWFLKIFEGCFGMVTAFFAVSFCLHYTGVRQPRPFVRLRMVLLAAGVAFCLLIPDTLRFYKSSVGIALMVLLQVAPFFPAVIIGKRMRARAMQMIMSGQMPTFGGASAPRGIPLGATIQIGGAGAPPAGMPPFGAGGPPPGMMPPFGADMPPFAAGQPPFGAMPSERKVPPFVAKLMQKRKPPFAGGTPPFGVSPMGAGAPPVGMKPPFGMGKPPFGVPPFGAGGPPAGMMPPFAAGMPPFGAGGPPPGMGAAVPVNNGEMDDIAVAQLKYAENSIGTMKQIVTGFVPTYLALALDVVFRLFLRKDNLPYMTLFGWQCTVVVFLFMLITNFAKIRKRGEFLSKNLREIVFKSTEELKQKAEELERQNQQNQKDLAMAAQVQKMFYPVHPNFYGWDIAVDFRPLSGVSGDLYDFYEMEGKLYGFGVFDVSGHGISAGLVTMLAKNAIFRTFRSSLSLNLSEAALRINEDLIHAKGNIENYLTGMLFRIDRDDPYKIEFVNAGHPYPILKQSKENAKFLKTNGDVKLQHGMFGMAGLDVAFNASSFEFEDNDVLILYTDGLTEAENAQGEQYGKERLLQLVSGLPDEYDSTKILSVVKADLESFVGAQPLEDDLTLIVVKRTEEVAYIKAVDDEVLESLEAVDDD